MAGWGPLPPSGAGALPSQPDRDPIRRASPGSSSTSVPTHRDRGHLRAQAAFPKCRAGPSTDAGHRVQLTCLQAGRQALDRGALGVTLVEDLEKVLFLLGRERVKGIVLNA